MILGLESLRETQGGAAGPEDQALRRKLEARSFAAGIGPALRVGFSNIPSPSISWYSSDQVAIAHIAGALRGEEVGEQWAAARLDAIAAGIADGSMTLVDEDGTRVTAASVSLMASILAGRRRTAPTNDPNDIVGAAAGRVLSGGLADSLSKSEPARPERVPDGNSDARRLPERDPAIHPTDAEGTR